MRFLILVALLGSDDCDTRDAAQAAIKPDAVERWHTLRRFSQYHPDAEVRRRTAALWQGVTLQIANRALPDDCPCWFYAPCADFPQWSIAGECEGRGIWAHEYRTRAQAVTYLNVTGDEIGLAIILDCGYNLYRTGAVRYQLHSHPVELSNAKFFQRIERSACRAAGHAVRVPVLGGGLCVVLLALGTEDLPVCKMTR